ncbi:MAG: hypothetical protein AAFO06_03665 [Cyanobacteria bacterium J06597_16]
MRRPLSLCTSVAASQSVSLVALTLLLATSSAVVAQQTTTVVPANPTPVNAANESAETDADLETPIENAAINQPAGVIESETDIPEPAPLVTPANPDDLTTYSEDGLSIDFPLDWTTEVAGESVMIANVTTVETELVATQVVRMAAPPGAVVQANIDSFIEEGSTVGRYQSTTIDDQDALMIWLSERPDDALTSAIATFVGYGDETILLFSRYAPSNETAEDDILRIHTSVRNLTAETVSSPEADIEAPTE